MQFNKGCRRMKVLIIDDDDSKIKVITTFLLELEGFDEKNIVECTNIIDAKRELRSKKYDILLLDMQLPIRDKGIPMPKAGLDLLNELRNHRRFNQPKLIIGITAFEKELNSVKDDFDNILEHVVYFSLTSDGWKNQLTEKFDYFVSSRENLIQYQYDIAIVCALKTPELDAVKKAIGGWSEEVVENDKGTKYYSSSFNGRSIIVASAFQMGMPASTALSMKIINLFRPKYLFMAGICAGIEGSVNLGDIIVVDQSWDYGSGKINSKDDQQVFQIEPYPLRLGAALKANALELQGKKDVIASIQNDWIGVESDKSVLRVHIGPMPSGAAVIANKDVANQVKDGQHRKLLGIEMEAYGVMCAAEYSPEPKPEVMVVKSVCDFADNKKNDDFHLYAAYTSASFIVKYIKEYC